MRERWLGGLGAWILVAGTGCAQGEPAPQDPVQPADQTDDRSPDPTPSEPDPEPVPSPPCFPDCECDPTTAEPCFEGPPESSGIGACSPGVRFCSRDGLWGECEGQGLPTAEDCNGFDDDCDGAVDEDFGPVACGAGVCQVLAPSCAEGLVLECEPNELEDDEVCDGLDNSCDGAVDEGCPCSDADEQPCYTGAADTRGVGACADGTQICVDGQWGACEGAVTPSAEVCDGEDNDCSGGVDDGGLGGGATCNTGLHGVCGLGVEACIDGELECIEAHEPTPEVCDGLDNDCNTGVDDGNPGGGEPCETGQDGVCAAGTTQCQGGAISCTATASPTNEVCDGLDNNCNGDVDETCPPGTCSHAVCDEGAALVQGCDPDGCVDAVCAADSYCCATLWDAQCVGEVGDYCALSC